MSPASAPSREKYSALLSAASKTAGNDNWKTSAGRVDGPDGFVAADAWRLFKIHFKSTSKPSVCPVCMDKPSSDEEWYITKSCRHAVCRPCLQNYASSLISDPNHSGPLKCPCCPRMLRVEDAKVALDGVSEPLTLSKRKVIPKAVRKLVTSKKHQERGGLFADPDIDDANRIDHSALDVLEKWDNKKRDELLRSMPSFRPCPHCSNGNGIDAGSSFQDSDNTANNTLLDKGGGGFVTPDCLQPINEERESNAERLLNMAGPPSSKAILLTYAIYYLYCGSRKSNNPALQIILALIPSALLPILPHALRLFLASMAKREIMVPIIVTCPCCLKAFNLEASSEFQLPDTSSGTAAEAATQRWKNTNTRPCPRCASPIMKDGGCNHVKCGKCRVDFCWACMRPRTSCRAYECKNGAPFGNGLLASGREGLDATVREREGVALIERIDNVEAAALRNLRLFRMFPLRYAAFIGFLFIVTSSFTIQRILSLAASFLFSNLYIICFLVVLNTIVNSNIRPPRRNDRGANIGVTGRLQHQNGVHGFNRRARLSFWRPGFRTEEDQLTEAISRSLVEQ